MSTAIAYAISSSKQTAETENFAGGLASLKHSVPTAVPNAIAVPSAKEDRLMGLYGRTSKSQSEARR